MTASSIINTLETPVDIGTRTLAALQIIATTTALTVTLACSEAHSCAQTAPQTPLTASMMAIQASIALRALWCSKTTSNPLLYEKMFTALYCIGPFPPNLQVLRAENTSTIVYAADGLL